MKTKVISQVDFKDSEVESILKHEIPRIQKTANEDAFIASFQNQSSASTIASISKEFDVLNVRVQKILEPANGRLKQEIINSEIVKKERKKNEEVAELDRKIACYEVEIERDRLTYDWKKYPNVLAGIILLSSIDVLLNYQSLQMYVSNLLLSIGGSLVIAGAIAYGLHTIGIELKSTQNKTKKALWILGAFIGAGILFYFLGVTRKDFSIGTKAITIIPLIWMMFCLIFFTIAFVVACRLLPSKEDKVKHRDVLNKIKRRGKLIEERDNKILNFEKDANDVKQLMEHYQARISYLQNTLMFLNTTCDSTIALYNKECDLRRNDNSFNSHVNRKGYEKVS